MNEKYERKWKILKGAIMFIDKINKTKTIKEENLKRKLESFSSCSIKLKCYQPKLKKQQMSHQNSKENLLAQTILGK